MSVQNVRAIIFEDDGRIPNNPSLPMLIYSSALPDSSDAVAACRALFKSHGWSGIWVNGIYTYHHYHSTAHEVLGIVRGTADVQFGGKQSEIIHVKAGDVVVIPAGVGHCNKGASPDLQVVGAYPNGQDWDLCTGEPAERPQVIENIRRVPLPHTDPVEGADGPLVQLWDAGHI